MTQPDRESSGDYGYDLAHENMAHENVPRAAAHDGPSDRERAGASPAAAKPDPDQDFGYDEAHDF
jgi:hypothetical protein